MTATAHTIARDDAIWHLLDADPDLTARQIAETEGISRSLAYAALQRLETAGRVVKSSDPAIIPCTWKVVGAPDDAIGTITVSESDARLIVHLLSYMVSRGLAGEPTEQLIDRIERALAAGDAEPEVVDTVGRPIAGLGEALEKSREAWTAGTGAPPGSLTQTGDGTG